VVEERLFGEVVRAASTGVELRQLGITDRRSQAQKHREKDADPHRGRRVAGSALSYEGQPEEGARCDQRHCVHGQAG
jgi:hypothetical protein